MTSTFLRLQTVPDMTSDKETQKKAQGYFGSHMLTSKNQRSQSIEKAKKPKYGITESLKPGCVESNVTLNG